MPAIFSANQIDRAVNWYERVPYTFLSTTGIPLTGQTVFSIPNIQQKAKNKMAILNKIGVTQTSGIQLLIQAMSNRRVEYTTAYPSTLTPILTELSEGFRSTGNLSLEINNNSGAATTATFQLNYSVAIKSLTTAERILYGLPLSSTDQTYQHDFRFSNQGIRPWSLSRSLEYAFLGQILTQHVEAVNVNVSSAPLIVYNLQPNGPDRILLVRKIASQATTGNFVSIVLSRDTDVDYVSILADNMTIGNPFDVWIPVRSHLNVLMYSQTAETGVPFRIEVLELRKTTLIRALLGELDPTELNKDDLHLYQQAMAGVIA